MASRVAAALRESSRATQWVPPDRLAVVQRASAAARRSQNIEAKQICAAEFINGLKERTMGSGSPYLGAL